MNNLEVKYERTVLDLKTLCQNNRNGNLYLQVRLTDRTGSLVGMLWNANEKQFNTFENGDFVRASGATQFYQGGLQVILNKIEPVDASELKRW